MAKRTPKIPALKDPTHESLASGDFNRLSRDDLTSAIAQGIERCAKADGLRPQDVTWVDFRRYWKYYWGESIGSTIEPRHITRVGGFAVIRDSYFPPDATEISVERETLRRQAREHRSVAQEATRNALLLKQIEDIGTRVFANKIVPAGYSTKKFDKAPGKIQRHLNLLLSDLHIRALLDDQETPIRFGPHEEARRLGHVALNAATYKEQYRHETQLNIFMMGDIVQGALHDARAGAPQGEQVAAAQWLLFQLVGYLASKFPKVVVRCQPGNHDRYTNRHKEQATDGKWDALTYGIYHSIKMACLGLKNVEVEITKRPFITYESFGIKGFGTHFDTVFKPGFPGTSIPVGRLETQISRLNASLPDDQEYKVVFGGHVHTGALIWTPSGVAVITNGALIPPDPYALSIGHFEANCGQTMWESVPGHIVGDYRYIQVGVKQDRDADLEKIIKPPEV